MNRAMLSKAVGDIDRRYILDAYRPVPLHAESSSERIVPMKKKKVVTLALAAALMLALGITAYAVAGLPHSVGTHKMSNTGVYGSMEDLPEAEKITGYPIHLVEKFSDGYAFAGMRVDGEAVYDENYAVLQEYYSVHAVYSSPGKTDMALYLSPVLDLEGTHEAPAPTSGYILGETEVRISRDHYKIVPEDYEKTEEDLAGEAAGHYYVSFGSDEIEERENVSASFELDGVTYSFQSWDTGNCTDDMLIRMASEILASAGE